MSAFDVAVGQAVREARKAAGMSQNAVAKAMRQRGFRLVQSVFSKVEAGERSVRLEEALHLQAVLPSLRLIDFTADEDTAYRQGYQAALRDARDAIGELS